VVVVGGGRQREGEGERRGGKDVCIDACVCMCVHGCMCVLVGTGVCGRTFVWAGVCASMCVVTRACVCGGTKFTLPVHPFVLLDALH